MAENFREVCARAVAAKGGFRDPWVKEAFTAVDRAQFVPARIWSQTAGPDGLYPLLDREQDPHEWHRAAWDPHRSAITQLDDHRHPEAPARGDFTSSVSAPDTQCEMLCQLRLRPGHNVLEIGTGSGHFTALLCERVGAGNVTSVEVDKTLADQAARNLESAGYRPHLVHGDGTKGWQPGGPYDRIVATAALRRVPAELTGQMTRRGGVLLAPFGTCYANGGLLRLEAREDGGASGRFTGTAHYMWVREQRPGRELNPSEGARKASSPLHPGQVLGASWRQDFTLGLRVPDVAVAHRGEREMRQAQLWDQTGTSVTLVNYSRWWEATSVTCYGPRDLWAELVEAYTEWRSAGQPDVTRYGITVEPAGEQYVWRDQDHGEDLSRAGA
ncbi:protein-L-isoaspartate O-methyltransferase family protein [Streptomyces sp. TR02-1]|uniref:protein-L-isoaspartate O-methyltransferase family protein n=1 Tax=Streptomyces sp. TR02-1 TaxID=3385977 RepID=UPI0039A1F842